MFILCYKSFLTAVSTEAVHPSGSAMDPAGWALRAAQMGAITPGLRTQAGEWPRGSSGNSPLLPSPRPGQRRTTPGMRAPRRPVQSGEATGGRIQGVLGSTTLIPRAKGCPGLRRPHSRSSQGRCRPAPAAGTCGGLPQLHGALQLHGAATASWGCRDRPRRPPLPLRLVPPVDAVFPQSLPHLGQVAAGGRAV